MRTLILHPIAIVFALVTGGTAELVGQEPAFPRTPAEVSDFAEYTTYDEMWTYLDTLQEASADVRVGVYGTSGEGRALPYLVYSRPSVTEPWEAWALGRPILVLAANVHGGERTLRESVLILARELAEPGTAAYDALDRLTILVVPQLNPDGFAAPGGATRGNAAGVDLNRDYMKLEHPEIRAFVQELLLGWSPHLFVDGHDGGAYPYNLNYQCPSHAAADPRITALCDDQIFPAVDEALEGAGYRAWYYQRGTATRWDVGGSDPRIGRNYGGFANMVGILFESEPSQSMADGVRSGLVAYRAVIAWAHDNVATLTETVRDARLQAISLGAEPRGSVPISVEYEPEPRSVEYLISSGSGEPGDLVRVQSDSLMKRPVATHVRPRPWAYVIPAYAEDAIALVRAHGVRTEVLRETVRRPVVAYRIVDTRREAAYDHPAAVRVTDVEEVAIETELPAGSVVVRTGQMRGRVAAHLLEPETTDGVVYWNRMDAWLPTPADDGAPPALFPIYKMMEPTPLPATLE